MKFLNKLLTILFLLVACSNTYKEKIFGGQGYQIITHSDYLTNGEYIFSGETSHNSWSKSDIDIYKTDSDLNLIWKRQISGFNDEILIEIKEISEKIYVFGNTNSEDGNLAPSLGGKDAFIYVFDKEGETLFNQRLGGSGSDSIKSVSFDMNGNIYLLVNSDSINGDFVNQNDLNDDFLVKMNSNLEIQWYKEYYGNTYFFLNEVRLNLGNEIFLAGKIQNGTFYFQNGSKRYNYDSLFIKLNSNGEIIKTFQLTDYNNLHIHDFKFDFNNNLVLVGLFGEDFISAFTTIIKLDNNLNIIWENVYTSSPGSGNTLNKITILQNSTILVEGISDMIYPYGGTNMDQSIVILKFDGSGNFIFQKNIDATRFTLFYLNDKFIYSISKNFEGYNSESWDKYDALLFFLDVNLVPEEEIYVDIYRG
jgi:hypothetical protein